MEARPTARRLQAAILEAYYARSFTLPNYTPAQWFECDVFHVTEAGYFVEFEVKLDFQDFLADFDKRRDRWSRRHPGAELEDKHVLLQRGSEKGPARFWFVVPSELEDKVRAKLPPYAGLGVWHHHPRRPHGLLRPSVQAPRIHGAKVDPEVAEHARGVCYWRLVRMVLEAARR